MKFHVSKMAKVNNADIEIKPLTIFVGRNGTNKSYMAHLVYELNKEIAKLDEKSKLITDMMRTFITPKLVNSIGKLLIEKKEKVEHYPIGEDEYETETYMEYMFKVDYTHEIFEKVYNQIISMLLARINKSYNTEITTIEDISFDYQISDIFLKDIPIAAEEDDEAYVKFIRKLFQIVVKFLNSNMDIKESFYFPSSRTGFVLAFDEIVSGVFRDRFGGQPTATKLTEPTVDFLSNFAEIKTGKFRDDYDEFSFAFLARKRDNYQTKIIKKLIKYLEKEVLQGEIVENNASEDYTQYKLKTFNDVQLDLHVSSSATIELLPLIVFFKHFIKIKNRLLVIEEPEAHLHPNAQIHMARFITMLVNSGAQVLITTHSDYMIEEFNNCIKLKNTKPKIIEEHNLDHGLGEIIHLNDNDINFYMFEDNKTHVEVVKLDIDEDGLPQDNFTDVKNELRRKKEILN